MEDVTFGYTAFARDVYNKNIDAGWWKRDPATGEILERNPGELLALIHSEIDEGYAGWLEEIKDDHLPHRDMLEVELADTKIRLGDMIGHYDIDVDTLLEDNKPYFKSIGYHIDNHALFGTTPELLGILHLDVSNALEGVRKGKTNENLPQYLERDVRLAEALYRVDEIGHYLGLDIDGAVAEKRAYNANRADHKLEARQKEGGKKF